MAMDHMAGLGKEQHLGANSMAGGSILTHRSLARVRDPSRGQATPESSQRLQLGLPVWGKTTCPKAAL